MSRPAAAALVIDEGQRVALEGLAASQAAPHRQVQRAKALLLAADGVANSHIAQRIGVSVGTVRAWRDRFAESILEKDHRGRVALNQSTKTETHHKQGSRRDPHIVQLSLRPRFHGALPAIEASRKDPLLNERPAPARTGYEILQAMRRIRERAQEITLPLLIMHGTDDHLTNPHGSERFFKLAGSEDKELKLYEDLYHEILNELEWERVLEDIVVWLDARS